MRQRPLFWTGTIFILFLSILLYKKEELFYSAALAAESSFTNEEKIIFQGTVKNIEKKENQTVLTLIPACIRKGQESYDAKGLLVYLEGSYAGHPGETLLGEGLLAKITEPENPGQFNARSYYYGKKIDYRIFSAEIKEGDGKINPYLQFLQLAKETMMKGFETVFDENDAGVLQSMVLGDRTNMDEELYFVYQLAGIAHIFAISGLHIGLVGRGLYGFLRKIGLKFFASFLISLGFIISYGILTGASPSAVRAIVMFSLSVFAKVCGRSYDLLTAIMVAFVGIVIENPFALQQSGVWLSFGAVLAIGLIYPVLEKAFNFDNSLWKSFCVSFSVHIFTLPVLAYSFFQFSTYGLILNLVVIPIMTFVFVSGGVAGILGMVLPELGIFAGGMAHYILMFYESVCREYIKIPGAVFLTGRPEKWQILLYYGMLLLGMIHLKKAAKKAFLKRRFVFVLYFAFLVIVLCPLPNRELEITMMDVGQGDGMLIEIPSGVRFFVDGGSSDIKEVGKYRILPFLKSKGIGHIDRWIITHGDSDHYSGFAEVLEEVEKGFFSIGSVCLPVANNPGDGYKELCDLAKEAGVEVKYAKEGDIWNVEKANISFLHPAEDYINEGENDYSLVFLLKYGKFSGLFTGDVEGKGETHLEEYFSEKNPLTLLKVAHHGSENSTTMDFWQCVKPSVAFISAGVRNSYGHPAKSVVERLKNGGCKIYNTKEQGAVWLKTDGKSFGVGWQMEK